MGKLPQGKRLRVFGPSVLNEFLRMKMREDSYWRILFPIVRVAYPRLDQEVDTDTPVRVIR